MRFVFNARVIALLALSLLAITPIASAQDEMVTLTLVGYSVPREAYAEIIPMFQEYWLAETGQTVEFEESFAGSGAQSRAVVGGFEADVVALSHEDHVKRIAEAGLITVDWQDNAYFGMVSNSVAVIAVRPGNPENIADWVDLARDGIEVITPDPATSGGAQWNVMGAYGAAYRGNIEGYEEGADGASAFLTDLFTNVSAMDADARESFLTFERGVGDAAITYENEVFTGLDAGGEYEMVYPTSTILIENPIAVVDVYAEQHGVLEAAQAFVEFTYSDAAQTIFAEHGFRPAVATILEENEALAALFPPIEDLFTIRDFGGWETVVPAIFGDEGVYTRMIATVREQ